MKLGSGCLSNFLFLIGIVLVTILFPMVACDSLPKSVAEKHLNLLKAGKSDEAHKQLCNPLYPQVLKTVDSFKIIDEKLKKTEKYPVFEYTSVKVELESEQFSQNKILTIDVWKTEDFYQKERDHIDKPLSSHSRNPQKRKEADEWHEQRLPKRDSFSKERQCVSIFVHSSSY